MVKRFTLTKLSPEVQAAYKYCQTIAKQHYENFPVASFLLPKYLRRSVAAIYAFARTADDIADEGDLHSEARLELMTKYETSLYDIQYGKPPTEPLFIALQHTIECFNLPIQLFYDLLTAFRQDILKSRYQNFAEVKDYCHYSANPIGRLLLHLAGQASRKNLLLSDNICTGLQLINFVQDIEIDLYDKKRCYIPLDELSSYQVDLSNFRRLAKDPNYARLIHKQIRRAREIYQQGMRLGHNLPGFFGIEIRFIVACGEKVLDKLEQRTDLSKRPIITKIDLLCLFCKVLFRRDATIKLYGSRQRRLLSTATAHLSKVNRASRVRVND
jgi:squalene synthase HpnC